MIKTITKIGNSNGIIFDAALMDMAHLKTGDQVNVTLHEGGTVILTPVKTFTQPTEAAAKAKNIIRRNADLFRRLS
jgi:antitoxin component of MazEF toxin-antitoxin module